MILKRKWLYASVGQSLKRKFLGEQSILEPKSTSDKEAFQSNFKILGRRQIKVFKFATTNIYITLYNSRFSYTLSFHFGSCLKVQFHLTIMKTKIFGNIWKERQSFPPLKLRPWFYCFLRFEWPITCSEPLIYCKLFLSGFIGFG